MADAFYTFFHNEVLITAVIAWCVAQVTKTIIHAIINHGIDFRRLIGDGGMPSAHSATMTAAALTTGLKCGFDSPVFAVMFLLAAVVMHDAHGVRLETGKQAKIINEMMDTLEMFNKLDDGSLTPEQKLKEFVGHTPVQVFGGFCVGILVALLRFFLR